MSADWFCKIGEKKYGPLNGQQLKTIVAKGQLKPEHLVRRGNEGPWVPAGRIKGLFPEGAAGSARSQGKKPKAGSLPTAAEAPAPPAADIPQELRLGGHHKHHVEMNFDKLDIDAMPVDVSRRKLKSGLKGLKKEEQKKLTILLWCFGGGGIAIGLLVFITMWATGRLSGTKVQDEQAKFEEKLAQPADSGKKTEKDSTEKKSSEEKDTESWKSVGSKMLVDNVEVNVLKPVRGAPPKGSKVKEGPVLIVPVTLELKGGKKTEVELTSWTDESLEKKVSLKDDKDSYDLLDQVPAAGSDGKTITKERIKVQLVFEDPGSKKLKSLKSLKLKLPAAAFGVKGKTICYRIDKDDIQSAKPADSDKGDKSDKADKSDDDDSAKAPPKADKKKARKPKAADSETDSF